MTLLAILGAWTFAGLALALWLGAAIKANGPALCPCGDCGQRTAQLVDAA